MRRRLLIADRYDAPAIQEVMHDPAADVSWDILLLGLSNPWFRWKHPGSGTGRWQLVDPLPHAADASERTGEFVVNLVERLPRRDLGGEKLGDLLETPEGTSWWFLDITEKGPFRGPLVSQLYRVALVRAVMDRGAYGEVRAQLANRPLADVFKRAVDSSQHICVLETAASNDEPWWDRRPLVRYWLHAAVAIARLAAIRVFLTASGHRAAAAPQGLAAFTFFPVWWAQPFSPDAADRFFSHLGEAGATGYLAWLTSTRTLWRNRRAAAGMIQARALVPLQAHLGFRDVLPLLSIRTFARVWRFERRARPALREPFAGLDVGPLVAADLSRSLTGTERWLSTLLARAVRRSVNRRAPRWLLYRLEFQPFESALLRGLRGRARGIGFLHYPFGRHYLSTRFAEGEVPRYLSGADPSMDRPLPDGVLACGESGIGHVTDSGYPRARCAPCGPQRFGRLLEYRRTHESRERVRARLRLPRDRPVYFVTLAIVEEDTQALFGALAGGLDTARNPLLVVRTHPNRPHGDPALTAALARFGPSRAVLMDPRQDIYDHLVAADALICIGSMIAFEAIALGRMPIVFENPSSFPALSLAEFAEGLFVARDEAEMGAALHAIECAGEDIRTKQRHWPDLLRRVLGDLETPLPLQLTRALARLDDAPRVGANPEPAPEAGVS
jgi:hypothetical protein